jgi:hypothetical protein
MTARSVATPIQDLVEFLHLTLEENSSEVAPLVPTGSEEQVEGELK